MNYTAPLSKHWQIAPANHSADAVQGADDIDLCIQNILMTRKGSDPLRPEFGSNYFDYIDQPEDIFLPNAVREVVLAVQTWEPRAVVDKVNFEGAAPHIGMTVHWHVADEVAGEIYITQVQTWI